MQDRPGYRDQACLQLPNDFVGDQLDEGFFVDAAGRTAGVQL